MSHNQEIMYLDTNGNYGNAVGMLLIDVKAMPDEVKSQWEKALDGPLPLREFFFRMDEEGRLPSHHYLVEGTGIVLGRSIVEGAHDRLVEAGMPSGR